MRHYIAILVLTFGISQIARSILAATGYGEILFVPAGEATAGSSGFFGIALVVIAGFMFPKQEAQS